MFFFSFRIPDTDAKKPDGKRRFFFLILSNFLEILDWDETEPKEIPDESATMPDGWLEDEPSMIPDPSAVRPTDWYD